MYFGPLDPAGPSFDETFELRDPGPDGFFPGEECGLAHIARDESFAESVVLCNVVLPERSAEPPPKSYDPASRNIMGAVRIDFRFFHAHPNKTA